MKRIKQNNSYHFCTSLAVDPIEITQTAAKNFQHYLKSKLAHALHHFLNKEPWKYLVHPFCKISI